MLTEIYAWFTEGFDTRRPERSQVAAGRSQTVVQIQLLKPECKLRRCPQIEEMRERAQYCFGFFDEEIGKIAD